MLSLKGSFWFSAGGEASGVGKTEFEFELKAMGAPLRAADEVAGRVCPLTPLLVPALLPLLPFELASRVRVCRKELRRLPPLDKETPLLVSGNGGRVVVGKASRS